MLIYGNRSAVDSALSRLVSEGYIYRLARGVFVRDLSGKPTLAQIVEAKLKAFGGKIAVHGINILSSFDLAKKDAYTFAKNGSSSSFDTIRGRAILKNQCARKMKLYIEEAGRAAIALWHHRKDWIDRAVDVVTASFKRTCMAHLRVQISLSEASNLRPEPLFIRLIRNAVSISVCIRIRFKGRHDPTRGFASSFASANAKRLINPLVTSDFKVRYKKLSWLHCLE
jgi:hypothetical protein